MQQKVRRTDPSPGRTQTNLWSNLGVISGIAGAALAVPAAFVSIVQASGAEKDAENARRERIATEQLAATSRAALEEARRLSSETSRLADASVASAGQLAAMSQETRRSRESLEKSSRAAEALSDAAKRQLALGEQVTSISTRARVITKTVTIGNVEAGTRPTISILLENLNPSVPAQWWSAASIRFLPENFNVPLTNCGDQHSGKIWTIGRETYLTLTGTDVSTDDADQYRRGEKNIVVNGMICYISGGKVYRTQFCNTIVKGEAQACWQGNRTDWEP